jgi:hypothetical protein
LTFFTWDSWTFTLTLAEADGGPFFDAVAVVVGSTRIEVTIGDEAGLHGLDVAGLELALQIFTLGEFHLIAAL